MSSSSSSSSMTVVGQGWQKLAGLEGDGAAASAPEAEAPAEMQAAVSAERQHGGVARGKTPGSLQQQQQQQQQQQVVGQQDGVA
jgi:hypothetical protein